MNADNLYYPISGFVNAATSIILGFFVYIKNRTSITHVTCCLFCLSIGVWSIFYFAWQITDTKEIALFYSRCLMAAAIFIPAFFLHHVLALVDLIKAKKYLIVFVYSCSIMFLLWDFTPYYVSGVEHRLGFKFWPTAGILFSVFLPIWASFVIYSLGMLIKNYRTSHGTEKNRLRYMIIATVIGWGGGATNFPLWYGVPIPPFLNILVSLYIVIVAYAIVRHHLLDIEVVIRKTVVFAALFTIVFAIFIGITLLTQELIAEGRILGLAISAGIIVIFVKPLENFLVRITDKYLFQKKYDYRVLTRRIIITR